MSEATNNEVEWPQTDRRRHIVTNMLLAVGVAPLVIMLHEYAHAVAQLLLGAGGSTVRALSAEAATALPAASQGWSAAAGPLFSLVSGLLVWAVARRLRGWPFQIAFWYYVAGLQNFFGYLVITPFGVGDSSTVVAAWGWPVWSQFVMPAVGVGGMFGIAAMVAMDVQARYRTPRGMLMAVHWPVLWASLVVIALTAVLAVVSGYGVGVVIAMVTSTMSMYVAALMSSMYWGRFTHRSLDKSVGRLVPAAVFAGAVVVVWVLHGAIGVTLG